jgi:hypothetical protein
MERTWEQTGGVKKSWGNESANHVGCLGFEDLRLGLNSLLDL